MGRLVVGGLTQQREVQVLYGVRKRFPRGTEESVARRSLNDLVWPLVIGWTAPDAQIRHENNQQQPHSPIERPWFEMNREPKYDERCIQIQRQTPLTLCRWRRVRSSNTNSSLVCASTRCPDMGGNPPIGLARLSP